MRPARRWPTPSRRRSPAPGPASARAAAPARRRAAATSTTRSTCRRAAASPTPRAARSRPRRPARCPTPRRSRRRRASPIRRRATTRRPTPTRWRAQADLAITKTDGVTTATPGGSVTYTITASNAGPSNATGATVADTFPASLTCTWTCVGAGGGTCTAAGARQHQRHGQPAGGRQRHLHRELHHRGRGDRHAVATPRRSRRPRASPIPTPGNNSATDTRHAGARRPTSRSPRPTA